MFETTSKYGTLEIDVNNLKIKIKDAVYDLKNIDKIDVKYVFRRKAKKIIGDIVLIIKADQFPTIKYIIKKNVPTDFYVEGGQIKWMDPQIVIELKRELNAMIKQYEMNDETNLLAQAKVLFDLPDIYTEDELKEKRRVLLKQHHPDNGNEEDMAIKINVYYDILQKNIDCNS